MLCVLLGVYLDGMLPMSLSFLLDFYTTFHQHQHSLHRHSLLETPDCFLIPCKMADSRSKLQRSKEFINNLDLKNKLKLHDLEARFIVPRPADGTGEPVRSRDDRALPMERLFWFLVALYKVYLFVESICIVLVTVVFGIAILILIRDEREKEEESVAIAVPILILVALIMIAHNVVAWTGIITFRLRYMWADVWLNCLAIITTIAYLILLFSVGTLVGLLINIVALSVVYFLIHLIRAANP